MHSKWLLQLKKADFNEIAKRYSIDPVTVRVLRNREVDLGRLDEYFNPSLSMMNSPNLMKDMGRAVEVIKASIASKDRIRIISDYDVDGVMSNYVLYSGLSGLGALVDYKIPDRVLDGYGINKNLIEDAYRDGIRLIVTCDNGIAASEAISYGHELGMKIVVTDHHDIPYVVEDEGKKYILPAMADAIVDPKREDCEYPYKGLCGAVVAYKLIEALYMDDESKEEYEPKLSKFLPMLALATVCDVMDLDGENRTIVKLGLDALNHTDNIGLNALINECGLRDRQITAYHLGFVLGPCINATGRLENAESSMDLLTEENEDIAKEKARNLKDINTKRVEMTFEYVDKAIEYVENNNMTDSKVMVVYLPDCHESLAGIIAGRIRDKYYRPALVITGLLDELKGSARSIDGYNMHDALVQCNDLLIKYGGHAMAAGFSLHKDKLNAFSERLIKRCTLTEDEMIPIIKIDAPMPMSYVTLRLVKEFERLNPMGKGNPRPVFAQRDMGVERIRIFGQNQNVVKLKLVSNSLDGENVPAYERYECVYFDAASLRDYIIDNFGVNQYDAALSGKANSIRLNIAYYPELDSYNGTERISFRLIDFNKPN